MGEKVTCIVFVYYLIFWDSNKDDIHKLAMYLQDLGVDLEQEDDNAGFLGVTLEKERDTGFLDMKQTRFIQPVIEAVGLDDGILQNI